MAHGWDQRLTRDNAFDAVRLILASLVVFEHSFVVATGDFADEPIYRLTGGQVNAGALAVFFFLVVSGFLVTRSRIQSSLAGYAAKRIARIVPGFMVATLAGVFVVGPLTASLPYLQAQNWPRIAATALALKQVDVVGALPHNPLSLVHGALWTIRYEVDCYILIGLMGVLGLLSGRRAAAAMLAAGAALLALHLWPPPAIDRGPLFFLISSPDRWGSLFPFFFIGAAFCLWRERLPKSPWLAAAALAWMALSARFGGFYWAALIGGAYLVLYAALSLKAELRIAGRKVDLSYGVYLYGWPVQQLVVHYLHGGPLTTFAITMPLTLALAFVSWVLVEKPALDLVHRARRARSAMRPIATQSEPVGG